jgi:hypothetical protein
MVELANNCEGIVNVMNGSGLNKNQRLRMPRLRDLKHWVEIIQTNFQSAGVCSKMSGMQSLEKRVWHSES